MYKINDIICSNLLNTFILSYFCGWIGDKEVDSIIPVKNQTSQRGRWYDQERLSTDDWEIPGWSKDEIIIL